MRKRTGKSQEETQMGKKKKKVKWCSALLVIWEIQSKINHFTSIRKPKIRGLIMSICGESMVKGTMINCVTTR